MGVVKNISFDKFPEQGSWLGKQVMVCFGYDTSRTMPGRIIREDREEPYETLILLNNGNVVRAVECQFALGE